MRAFFSRPSDQPSKWLQDWFLFEIQSALPRWSNMTYPFQMLPHPSSNRTHKSSNLFCFLVRQASQDSSGHQEAILFYVGILRYFYLPTGILAYFTSQNSLLFAKSPPPSRWCHQGQPMAAVCRASKSRWPEKKKSCELRGLPILSLNFGFVSGDFYGFITILEPTHCWGNTVVLWVVFSKHQNRSKSPKLPWQKGIFNSSLAPTPMALKEMSFSCFGLQICRVITKKIVERTLAVMDQGKKLCSLGEYKLYMRYLLIHYLVFHCFFRMDFQEIDPYKNPITTPD